MVPVIKADNLQDDILRGREPPMSKTDGQAGQERLRLVPLPAMFISALGAEDVVLIGVNVM
ncbi:hypothetical protein JL39_04450 [Rhizobium sp. YS-1r]|nr:hypothetical protein JL39_04450 [Rhizobium sp. YS-1r]